MCVVIDTCCLAQVFDRDNQYHTHFAPILQWVTKGKGRIIYGGTKYNTELRRAVKFLRVIVELNRSGRAIRMDSAAVDRISTELRTIVCDPAFNDEHLAALIVVSRCCIICTNDIAAMRFLKRRDLYSRYDVDRPKIYCKKRHECLCCDRYLAPVCR